MTMFAVLRALSLSILLSSEKVRFMAQSYVFISDTLITFSVDQTNTLWRKFNITRTTFHLHMG